MFKSLQLAVLNLNPRLSHTGRPLETALWCLRHHSPHATLDKSIGHYGDGVFLFALRSHRSTSLSTKIYLRESMRQLVLTRGGWAFHTWFHKFDHDLSRSRRALRKGPAKHGWRLTGNQTVLGFVLGKSENSAACGLWSAAEILESCIPEGGRSCHGTCPAESLGKSKLCGQHIIRVCA